MNRLRSLVLACSLLVSAGALAQEGEQEGEDAAESRAAAFQAVEGPDAEQVPGGMLLIGAYGFVLVLLIGYVGRLGKLQSKTLAEVERLSQSLSQARKG